MKTIAMPVLLVGSVPGSSPTAIMETCARNVGDLVYSLPDGELGMRAHWIVFVAYETYARHKDIEVVRSPLPVDPNDPEEWRPADWHMEPKGYNDHWVFRVRGGVDELHFDSLGYAAEIGKTYPMFRELRDQGVIPRDVRFQVALPGPETCVLPFVRTERDHCIIRAAYTDALVREIRAITQVVPPHDLAIQFDFVRDVLLSELSGNAKQVFSWTPVQDPVELFRRSLGAILTAVPRDALLGLHLCYGNIGLKHLVEPRDLSVVVRLANVARDASARRIDWFHMPVPKNRDDDDYFAPLKSLNIDMGSTVYLGLVHSADGVEGTLRRLMVCRRFISKFGIATECGLSGRPVEAVVDILRLHRQVAARA